MEKSAADRRTSGNALGECLQRAIERLGDDAAERRHEAVLERAEREIGLARDYAEKVYAIAEEEGLAPVYAFQLVGCDVGVRELQPQETDGTVETDFAAQQAPPGWEQEDVMELDDVALERQLRATFRRFRSMLEKTGDAGTAAQSFVQEPDVVRVVLRPGGAG